LTDAEALELWHERAAIREHDGQQSRQQAEFGAAADVKRMIGEVPECVAQAVRRGREHGNRNSG
jgi:hypothetical protein